MNIKHIIKISIFATFQQPYQRQSYMRQLLGNQLSHLQVPSGKFTKNQPKSEDFMGL